ncbi:MAG TPA: caspase family protein, partial [Dongiaceae bacterium]|nr:caspase family protein [Dongiaceae bacterium]
MSRALALLGVALWLVWSGEALGASGAVARVALVVGNGAYAPEIGKLKNPASDAQLMADALKGLGFEVAVVTDADQKAMKRAIREFGQKLRETGPNGIGLFYYAGHGVQVDGENFLLPVGAEIQAEGDVELEAVSAASILSQMQFAGNAVNLVFLDACRNNPLTRSFRSGSRGLARVDAPRGSFVGYSTAPGDVSVDGESGNSPYALALVEELNTPGISIEEAHRAVRGKVLAATNQRQTPWDSSSLTGPVILKALSAAQPPQVAAVTPPPTPPAGASTQQAELLFWDSIKDSDNPATFQAYLTQFPNGVFAGLARAKIDELKSAGNAPDETQSAARQIQPAAPQPAPAPQAEEKLDVALLAVVEPMSGVFVATRSVNVRAGASIEADIIGRLAADQAVDATGRIGDWLRISAQGTTGFVSGKLMAASDADEVAAWSALKGAPSEATAKSFIGE